MSIKNAQLFPSCLVNEFYPEVGFAAAKVLQGLGCNIDVPGGQVCCGQPAYNAGQVDDARKVARHLLSVFGGSDAPLVVLSGSCADMLKHQLPRLFEEGGAEHQLAAGLSARVREFSQFVVDDLGVENLGAVREQKVLYHPSCHLLRGLGVNSQPLRLLRAVQGTQIVENPQAEECCGFGGLFSETQPLFSGAMLENKLQQAAQLQPDWVVSCDLGCLMHLEGGARRRRSKTRFMHLAQYLAEGIK
jgi:L-lactate dehydrogenase complex protein LldE